MSLYELRKYLIDLDLTTETIEDINKCVDVEHGIAGFLPLNKEPK